MTHEIGRSERNVMGRSFTMDRIRLTVIDDFGKEIRFWEGFTQSDFRKEIQTHR